MVNAQPLSRSERVHNPVKLCTKQIKISLRTLLLWTHTEACAGCLQPKLGGIWLGESHQLSADLAPSASCVIKQSLCMMLGHRCGSCRDCLVAIQLEGFPTSGDLQTFQSRAVAGT